MGMVRSLKWANIFPNSSIGSYLGRSSAWTKWISGLKMSSNEMNNSIIIKLRSMTRKFSENISRFGLITSKLSPIISRLGSINETLINWNGNLRWVDRQQTQRKIFTSEANTFFSVRCREFWRLRLRRSIRSCGRATPSFSSRNRHDCHW